MSAINVNSITGRTGTHGPVLTGVTTVSDALVVGGTDSTAKLNVFGGDIQIGTGLTFKSSSSTGNLNLQGGYTYPGGWIKLSGGSSDDNIVFGTSSNNATKEERLRITSAGLVGIGTDNPSRQLEIFDSSQASLALKSSTTGQSSIWFADTDDINIGGVYYEHTNDALVMRTNDAEAARFNSSGNLAFPSGQGIDFSATSDGSGTNTSELLDDYETGNWTPVLKSNTDVITVTGSQNYYRYIKIGRLVTLFYSINNATTSGTTGGACTIAGLPFDVSSSTSNNRFISGDVMFYNTGFKLDAWPLYPHSASGDLTVNFYSKASAGAQYNSANVNTVGAGSYFFFTFTYYTD